MIRVRLGTAYHYGIYISDNEVIQFGLPPIGLKKISDERILVQSTSLDIFCNGGKVEIAKYSIKEKLIKNSKRKIISNARKSLGETGYNLLRNNCEHFAYRCVFDERLKTPSDLLRQQLRSKPVLHLYFSQIPETLDYEKLYPEERNAEIINIDNPSIKKEKYWAWKTLEYAMLRSFGIRLEKTGLRKAESGKWICNNHFISISHSTGLVCVAVSTENVGIDIESVTDFNNKFASHEKQLCNHLGVNSKFKLKELLDIWTQKEANYKGLRRQKPFNPRKIKINKKCTNTFHRIFNGKEYCYSIYSPMNEPRRKHRGIQPDPRLKDIMTTYVFETEDID